MCDPPDRPTIGDRNGIPEVSVFSRSGRRPWTTVDFVLRWPREPQGDW